MCWPRAGDKMYSIYDTHTHTEQMYLIELKIRDNLWTISG